MKQSEQQALRCLQNDLFEAVRKRELYAWMCDSVQRQIRDSLTLVLDISKKDPELGRRIAQVHDQIAATLNEVDR